jgi:putative Holliday junction resolvase
MKATRILAIDHGAKRIGVALSDELGWTAQPLQTYVRRTLAADLAHIEQLVQEHAVAEVLVGLPLRLNGEMGPAAQSVQQFVMQLERLLSVPVVTWDERMTTRSAEDLLIAADVSRKKRKGVIDRIAAAILLQSYLESRSDRAGSPRDDTGTEDGDVNGIPLEGEDEDSTRSLDAGSAVPHEPGGIPDPALGSGSGR